MNYTRTAPGKTRIIGIDAARGLALMGMIAVHVLPEAYATGEPTVTWRIAAGSSAALFAVLAGVSLALSTSAARNGRLELRAARAGLAARAVVVLVLGLLLGLLQIPAYIILTYYAVMFFLAIPLIGRGTRTLLLWTSFFAVAGTGFSWLISPALPMLGDYDPSMETLLSEPGATLSALLFSGTYPAIPWMTYICLGLAIGRMDLRSMDSQIRLVVTGALIWLGTAAASTILMGPLGGRQAILSQDGASIGATEIEQILAFGPSHGVELNSWWWHFALSPHSNLLFDMLHTASEAVMILGVMLLISRRWPWLLRPLCILGSMTLSLYTVHLLWLATGVGAEHPLASYWLQIGFALLGAVLWRNITGMNQGPLERLASTASKASSDALS